MLNRADLESGRLRQVLLESKTSLHVLTDAELQQSMETTLQQRPQYQDIWIFAYGSLIWNPIVHYSDRRIGTVTSWHRQFCLWTPGGRGTPENPGLVLGLMPEGHCQGVVYCITAADRTTELSLLWRREMIVGSYIPRWVTVQTDAEPLEAITFTINPEHPMYADHLPQDVVVQHIATAAGHLGTCAEYLTQTVAGLNVAGIEDQELFLLHEQVMARQQAMIQQEHS